MRYINYSALNVVIENYRMKTSVLQFHIILFWMNKDGEF